MPRSCAPFTCLQPGNTSPKDILERFRKLAGERGATLEGDEHAGKGYATGPAGGKFEMSYLVNGRSLSITIISMPRIIGCGIAERMTRGFVDEVCRGMRADTVQEPSTPQSAPIQVARASSTERWQTVDTVETKEA